MTFSYDGYGNIDSKSEYAYTLGELGTATDTVNYVYDSEWKDKLTSYDGQGITYDAIGNPTNYMGATMTWNGRQLMSYSKDGTNVSYTYDGDGLRTSKTVNGVKHNYYYVDGVLMYEKNDVYDYYYRYDQDGRLAMIIRRRLSDNYKWYYYIVSNTRGDIMEIHNGQGQITARYNYDAWGKLVSITNANGTPLADGSFAHLVSVRYRGYYYDTETGLYYLQSRYYDPETGRFLNADDVGFIGYSGQQLSFNVFTYCENNSIINDDRYGFFKGADHYNETYEFAKDYFSDDVANLLGAASKAVDDLYPPVINAGDEYVQSFHFNTNSNYGQKGDSRMDRSNELYDSAIKGLNTAQKYNQLLRKNSDNIIYRINLALNLTIAIIYFGMSIHPLQDQVAHCGVFGDMPFYNSEGTEILFRWHWLWGIDVLDSKYPLDGTLTKREKNKLVTIDQLEKIKWEFEYRGLYYYVS